MNPEAQRIAIAEACGWRCTASFKEAFACWVRPDGMDHQTEWLPNYLNDLNAMHEAEEVLNEKQEHIMNDTLWDLMLGRKYLWHATAAQRAEAFLKCIGLWRSGE